MKKIQFKERFKQMRSGIVALTNMCMIYDDKGNVLIEEKVGRNYKGLIFPGGHLERGEPIVDSVIREIKEETGLTISDLQICGVKDWIQKDGSRYIVFLYKTNSFSGEIKSSSEGEVFWIPLDELKKKADFWHLDKMLEVFCKDEFSEVFFDATDEDYDVIIK